MLASELFENTICPVCGCTPCNCTHITNEDSDPCWKGYKQIGMKNKAGKKVPNCVPEGTDIVPAANPEDAVTLDIPLLIRLLEYAREDAKTDVDLHNVAERLTTLSAGGKTLSMNDYGTIIPGTPD